MGFENTNVISETKDGRLIAEGVLQTADVKNRNNRIYPKTELFPQLKAPRTLELLEAGYLRAELGHPLSTELVRQQTIDDSRTCAQFLRLWTVGDSVWGTFRGTNNAFGEAFNADLKDGCKPAWSLRALGSIVETERGAEVRNLRIITWDQVIYPSHPDAYTRRIVSESGIIYNNNTEIKKSHIQLAADDYADILGESSRIIPITNQSAINYIKAESKNLKYVRESLDFIYDDITLAEDGNSVVLKTTDGDQLIVNLEKYISNEIMDYCALQSKVRDSSF
jgi:hypothetical protein